MIISSRTGRPLVTKSDIESVQRALDFAEALRLNFSGPIGADAEECIEKLGILLVSMNQDVQSRKKKVEGA